MFAVRPVVVRPPQDVTALVGSDATFECGASGDPTPHVVWRRQDGPLPAGRARSTDRYPNVVRFFSDSLNRMSKVITINSSFEPDLNQRPMDNS